jgi:putative ABC transport system ATP-binding protein
VIRINNIIIQANGITRTFGKGNSAVHALSGVNLCVVKGMLAVLKGRSGSGKTTLINILGALDGPTEGKIKEVHVRPGQRYIKETF